MARRRQPGRNVTGILLLDKPLGISSNDALQRVKRFYRAAKAGHTGSLDPLATGLLPVCLGAATKFSAFLLDADKRYRVRVRLGVTTTTADAEGEVVETRPVEGVDRERVQAVLGRFVGDIEQLPPMYSAVKHGGERLYKLARQGVEVERQPRPIRIFSLTLTDLALPEIELDVHCSKGTYVRTLAEDIGRDLGPGGHVSALRRTGVGPYLEATAAAEPPKDTAPDPAGGERTHVKAVHVTEFVTLDRVAELADREGAAALLDALLLPLESALDHWPAVRLSADAAFYLQQGQPVLVPQAPTEGLVRLYDPSRAFVGVGEILDDGRVQPKRLV